MTFFNIKYIYIYIFLFLLSLSPLFGIFDTDRDYLMRTKNEKYETKLESLDNIEKIVICADSVYQMKYESLKVDTSLYVRVISDLTKRRFQFGLAHYSISDNWIASILGMVFWPHFSAIVNPDDILKHSNGLCSQQTIVFMEALKARGINVRSVGLGKKEGPGHFVCEVFYENSWHLYDVTKEPVWNKINIQHESVSYYVRNKSLLYQVYENIVPIEMMDIYISNITYGNINEFPATNMLYFHKITYFLTRVIPLILFLLIFMTYYKNKQKTPF